MEAKKISSSLKSTSDKCQLTRFSDYFVICGLDLENGLEADLYSGEISFASLEVFLNLKHLLLF